MSRTLQSSFINFCEYERHQWSCEVVILTSGLLGRGFWGSEIWTVGVTTAAQLFCVWICFTGLSSTFLLLLWYLSAAAQNHTKSTRELAFIKATAGSCGRSKLHKDTEVILLHTSHNPPHTPLVLTFPSPWFHAEDCNNVLLLVLCFFFFVYFLFLYPSLTYTVYCNRHTQTAAVSLHTGSIYFLLFFVLCVVFLAWHLTSARQHANKESLFFKV